MLGFNNLDRPNQTRLKTIKTHLEPKCCEASKATGGEKTLGAFSRSISVCVKTAEAPINIDGSEHKEM